MKKIRKKILGVFVLVLAVACLCFPMLTFDKTALAESPTIQIEDGETSFSFSDFSNGQTKKISIENFFFQIGDKVVYYYTNTNSSSFSYKNLYDYNDDHTGSNEIEITSETISKNAEISINLLKMEGSHFSSTGVGTYVIKASIVRGASVFSAESLTLSVSDQAESGSAYRLTIYGKKTNDDSTEFGAYQCTATLTLNNTVVSLKPYEIKWYFVNGESRKAFTNAESFLWYPEAKGSYMMQAKVQIGSDVVDSNFISIDVAVDHTLEIILVALGVAVVMTIGVVIGVIVSVKRERVW